MSAPHPQPSDRLRAARRGLLHLERCRLVADLQWHIAEQCWWIEVELSHASRAPHLPGRTRWCLTIKEPYPYGDIQMSPCKDGGITATFPHQTVNAVGAPGVPWRNGNLCIAHPTQALGRLGELPSRDSEERLGWTVRRTLDWLDHAAHGELLVAGQPFELPSYGVSLRAPGLQVVVREDSRSLQRWGRIEPRQGLFDAVVCDRGGRRLVVVLAFRDLAERELWRLPDLALRGIRGHTMVRGFWARLGGPPTLEPWQAPRTWGELATAMGSSGDDLVARLGGLHPERLGLGERMLLLGAPVPEVMGGPPVELAWQALIVPRSMVPRRVQGRKSLPSLADTMTQRRVARRPIRWLHVANWSAERIEARGRLDARLRERPVVLLGAGALGSLVAELLVRGGVHALTIIDDDKLEVGNLVRHTLCAEDLHEPKAQKLAERLAGANPHAHVRGIVARVPSQVARKAIEEADVVIDCTAEDDVLQALGDEALAEPKRWLSAAVSVEARSLFVFMAQGRRFPVEDFFARMDPHAEDVTDELCWEGPGCWSPLFPARMDEMAIMAAVVVERSQALMERTLEAPTFEVFTRRVGADGRLERIELEWPVPPPPPLPPCEVSRDREPWSLPSPGSKRAWLGRWMARRLLAWSERVDAEGEVAHRAAIFVGRKE